MKRNLKDYLKDFGFFQIIVFMFYVLISKILPNKLIGVALFGYLNKQGADFNDISSPEAKLLIKLLGLEKDV